MVWRKFILPLLMLLAGVGIGYLVRDRLAKMDDKPAFIERREGPYRHVNPLLECDIAEDVLKNRELFPFKQKIETCLSSCREKGWASSVSVYFRDLNDGLWFGIGDTEKFVPASLRKLPLMIALLKMAEREGGSGLLDRPVKFDLARDYTADQNLKPSEMLVPGQTYPVRELIRRMIVHSDNNAFTLLTRVVDPAELDRVYGTLRIQNPRSSADDNFLSIQTYASFFRVLYNATYLGKEASDWALGTLAQSDFRAGLIAEVPPGVEVAHKFGEKSDVDGTVQLHDCGIVYYPGRPYLLCVMSKGRDFRFLDDAIIEVSRRVFDEVDAQHRGEGGRKQ